MTTPRWILLRMRNISDIICIESKNTNVVFNNCPPKTVAYRGGFGVFKPPPPSPKFRSFDKAEPNSQFRGKYIHNNLTRIWLSLIFWVVCEKPSPPAMTPTVVFFSHQGMTWRKHKVPKILPYEMEFLVPNYSCLQNSWQGGYRPQIPVLSVLCPQLNLLNSPPEQNSWVSHCPKIVPFMR